MGWRTDFKRILLDAFRGIENIGYLGSRWVKDPLDLPALIVSLSDEEYERTMGGSEGLVKLRFEISGKVRDLDDPDEAKEDLLDSVIEVLEGITGYDIVIESTDFHDKVDGGGPMFTLTVLMGPKEKDFSDM